MKDKPKPRNFVAKYMEQFNKPKTERNKRAYSRKGKSKFSYLSSSV